MALMDESVWRGKIYSGGWVGGELGSGLDAPVIEPATVGGIGASGTGARFGGAANLEAFTGTRWVTVRGDIAPYPFWTLASR
jgi:hypothetical protein